MPQDFTLFIILQENDICVWKHKLDWVVEQGGMALLIIHPDYMCVDAAQSMAESYPIAHYRRLLEYIHNRYEGCFWNPLPVEAARHFATMFPLDPDSHGAAGDPLLHSHLKLPY